ncbi:hypothetical protein ACTFIW_001653 [Dictyostelium discoideum]
MINFRSGTNQLSKYVENNKKFIFLETHLFHSKKTLDYFSTDIIVEYITEFTDYYNRVFRDKNNNYICKKLLQCILKLVRVVWLDKNSSSDSLLIIIDSMFKLILNVDIRDSIDNNSLVIMLDLLCQNKFFSRNRGIEPLSPLSPTRMININSSSSSTTTTKSDNLQINSPASKFSSSSSSTSYSLASSSSYTTPTKNYFSNASSSLVSPYQPNTPYTPYTPLNGMMFLSPTNNNNNKNNNNNNNDDDDSFSTDDQHSGNSSLSSSYNNIKSPIPFNHIVNPTTLKESYILLIPLLFLYCKNDKNYREIKKFFGNNIIENETFQYFTTYWSITTKPDDYIRCSNFILSLGNNSYLLKDNKTLFLNTIFNIINSYDLLRDKGIECLELHLMNFLDTEQFYERIIQEIYKHQEKFFIILKKLIGKDPKVISKIIEPHFSKLFKLFQKSSSFSMLNLLVKSFGKSFFNNNSSQMNDYINRLIQIPITLKLDNTQNNNQNINNINNSNNKNNQNNQNNNNNNNENDEGDYKKYEVLDSIVYLIKLLGGKEMVGHVRILMKHFRTIDYIKLNGAGTLEYESIIRSLVLLYKIMGDNYIQLFHIAINSIVKANDTRNLKNIQNNNNNDDNNNNNQNNNNQNIENNNNNNNNNNNIENEDTYYQCNGKHTGGMVILGDILTEFNGEQLRLSDIQVILKFIGSTCLCKREGLFPIFLDYYYRHSSWYEFNCYIERILQKDIKSNIDENYNNIIVEDEQQQQSNNSNNNNNGNNNNNNGNKNKKKQQDEIEDSLNNNNNNNIDDDCKIKSFINTLQFIKVIGKYCPNAYTTNSQRERIRKIYNGLIEKLPQSVVNVFMYASGNKKNVRFIYLLIPQLTSLIESLPCMDDIYTQFMSGILNCIYKRKKENPLINITPFIELMLILNNEYVPGSKSFHYDLIIKQNLLYYKNYGGGNSNNNNNKNSNSSGSSSRNNDFSLFIDRKNPRFLLFLNQVLPLSSYKFLKKLVISYPAQLAHSISFKNAFDKLTLTHKESIIKIIQSSSSYNPSLADLLKSLKRPIMPLIDDSFKNGYEPLLKTILNCGSSSSSSNNNKNNNNNNNEDCKSEWKMTLSLVCRDWFLICQKLLSNDYRIAKRMKIVKSINPGNRYCLFERLIHFSFNQILTYPMEQWKDIFKNSQSIDLSINNNNSNNNYNNNYNNYENSLDLKRHLDILVDIDEFPNLIEITLDCITSEGSSFNRIIDNLSNNQLCSNLKVINLKLTNLNHSEVDNVIEFFQTIYKNKQQIQQDINDDNNNNNNLKINIEILNSNCEFWLLPLINTLYEIFGDGGDGLRIISPYPDDKFLKIHSKKSEYELTRYYSQCNTITITPNPYHSYELFDYYQLSNNNNSSINKLIIQNCGTQGEKNEFGIDFELSLLSLLENSKSLTHLQINNITNLYQVIELFSCLPLNNSLISITLIINTLEILNNNNNNFNNLNNNNNNNSNNSNNNNNNNRNNNNNNNFIKNNYNNNFIKNNNLDNNNIFSSNNNFNYIKNNSFIVDDGVFDGSLFKEYLIQLFQLLNQNQTIDDLYISTHNSFPLVDDWNSIEKGDFILINPCHLQRKFKKR